MASSCWTSRGLSSLPSERLRRIIGARRAAFWALPTCAVSRGARAARGAAAGGSPAVVYATRRRRVPGVLPVACCTVARTNTNVVYWTSRSRWTPTKYATSAFARGRRHSPVTGPHGGRPGLPPPRATPNFRRRPRREVGILYAPSPRGQTRRRSGLGQHPSSMTGGEQTLVGLQTWAANCGPPRLRWQSRRLTLAQKPAEAAPVRGVPVARGRAAATIDSSGAALISTRVVAANSSRADQKKQKTMDQETRLRSRAPWAARTRSRPSRITTCEGDESMGSWTADDDPALEEKCHAAVGHG